MDIRSQIVARTETLFDQHGFAATGMDRLTAAAEVSSRTLYKHLGDKSGLICAVLAARQERFLAAMDVPTVDALFTRLEDWTMEEGARGCLFLRAMGDMGGSDPAIADQVAAYRQALLGLISRVVEQDLGHPADPGLSDQILVLFEGATSAASYLGTDAIRAARTTAALLMQQAR